MPTPKVSNLVNEILIQSFSFGTLGFLKIPVCEMYIKFIH